MLSEIRVGILVLFQMLTRRLSAFCFWVLYWVGVCHKWLLLCWDMVPLGFPGDSDDNEFACGAVDLGWPWGPEGPLEKAIATHSSILAWRIPWTEEPSGRQTVHGVAELDMTEQLTQMFPLYHFGKSFIMNRYWILSNAFSTSIEMIMWFSSFVTVAYHIDWFAYVDPFLWP